MYILYSFISLHLDSFYRFLFTCSSAFEQGHLEPWRYINVFIIINIIIPLTGDPPSNDEPHGEYPTVVTQDSGDEVLVVTAYAYGKYLGFLKLQFDDDGKITSWAGQPILLDSSVPQGKSLLSV